MIAANAAGGPDVIQFAPLAVPATLTISMGELAIDMNDPITIDGPTADPDDLVIDANLSSRVFDAFADITVQDVTIREGNTATEQGGAIRVNPAASTLIVTNAQFVQNNAFATGAVDGGGAETVMVSDSLFQNNHATGSSAGALAAGSLTVSNTDFEMNDAVTNGGAISAVSSVNVSGGSTFTMNAAGGPFGGAIQAQTVIVDNASFDGNSSLSSGGAISAGTVNVTAGTFTDNSTVLNGGAIAANTLTLTNSTVGSPTPSEGNTSGDNGGGVSAIGPVMVDGTTIENNQATGGTGGGIDAQSTVTVTDSTVSSNDALGGQGGGIHAQGAGNVVTIDSSTITGNTSPGEVGGGLAVAGPTATVTNSTITGNTAAAGGGIRLGNLRSLRLEHTTVIENSAPNQANFRQDAFTTATSFATVIARPQGGGPNCDASFSSDGYSYDDDGTCSFDDGPGDVSDGPDPMLGMLADIGGPTATMQPLLGSPLIDAIPKPACDPDIPVDQRGVARPVKPDCDIGAVEVDYRPDGRIKGKGGGFTGNNVYNDTGEKQKRTKKPGVGDTKTFTIRAESDATFLVDSFTITGPPGTQKFKATYLDGATDVTADVTGAGYTPPVVAPGDQIELKLQVKAKSAANSGNKRKFLVTTASNREPTHLDVVKAVAKVT